MDRSHKILKLLSQLEMLENEIAMTEIQLDEINTMSHHVQKFIEPWDVKKAEDSTGNGFTNTVKGQHDMTLM